MSEWKTIKSAPKDGTRILAWSPDYKDKRSLTRITWWRRPEDGAGYVGWGEFNMQYWPPTHWMPLPEPPRDFGDE
jgi:hypothetical protein